MQRFHHWAKVGRGGAGSVLVLLVLAGCGGSGEQAAVQPQAEVAGMLRRVRDAAELEAHLKAAMRVAPSGDVLAAAVAPSGTYSGTYTLEVGVDEADSVRYDGSLLAIATARSIRCCQIADPRAAVAPPPLEPAIRLLRTSPAAATAAEAGRIALEPGLSVQGMYLSEGRLVALTSEAYLGTYGALWTGLPYWVPRKHGIRIYDVSTPAAPRLQFSAQVDGTFVDSRRVGNALVVISRHVPRQLFDPAARVGADGAPLAELLPRITIDGASRALVDPARCYITADDSDGDSAVLTSITVFPLSDPGNFVTTCFNEDAYGVYVSPQSVYVTQLRATGPTTPSAVRTRIHRFGIGTAGAAYRGSGEIDGATWIGGQVDFRISESGDLLRVMTSQFTGDSADSIDHGLFVLRQNASRPELDVVGQLPNARRPDEIGKPGESLYGVRFVGDRAFASTFLRSDPLYAFDLSDPADPRVAGTLELPGFQDLLHPVSPGLLLGVGQADTGGVRVALFDVSRLDAPRELGGFTFGATGTTSDARTDRHAFAYLADATPGVDHFAIPLNLFSADGQYRFQGSSLQLFTITGKNQPATALLRSAGQITSRATSINPQSGPVARSRAFLHPDSVFYVADDEVRGASWTNPGAANGPF